MKEKREARLERLGRRHGIEKPVDQRHERLPHRHEHMIPLEEPRGAARHDYVEVAHNERDRDAIRQRKIAECLARHARRRSHDILDNLAVDMAQGVDLDRQRRLGRQWFGEAEVPCNGRNGPPLRERRQQAGSLMTALPFSVILLLMCMALVKALSLDRAVLREHDRIRRLQMVSEYVSDEFSHTYPSNEKVTTLVDDRIDYRLSRTKGLFER